MRKTGGIRVLLTGVVTLLALFSLAPVAASSANISHSYESAGKINTGSLVSLDPQRSDYVVTASTDNGGQLLGVAVIGDDSLLAVDVDKSKVQIATSGTVTTLVSTINGPIKVGDQIAVSPFEGVGMKAEPGSYVIGLAQSEFDGKGNEVVTQQVSDKDGKSREIKVGFASVNIGIGTASTQGSDANLNGVQKLTKRVTGQTVSSWRAVVSLIVAIVALAALVTLIYASIYGSIISIGRNPLAKYAVFRTLSSVLAMAAITAMVAGGTIFLLLR